MNHRIPVPAALASLLLFAAAAPAALPVQTPEQQACIRATNRAFVRVAAAEAKLASACIKAVAGGKAVHASVEACIAADTKGKVASAAAKAGDAVTKACSSAPDFGAADQTGAAAVAAASGAREEILEELFGAPIDGALALKATDKDAAACQAAIVKVVDRCWKARAAQYEGCAAEGLAVDVVDESGLAACRDGDAEGDVAAACVADVQEALDGKCDGADVDALLPGCECRYSQDCIALTIANAANARLSDAASLPAAATVMPETRRPMSHLVGPWITPAHGEISAARVRGREVDAPIACPLGALNVYTIQDPVADVAYNNGVAPLLANQGVRVLMSPKTPTDLTGVSVPEMVQGTQAMPLYAEAQDLLHLATRFEMFSLTDEKHEQVLDTLYFGLQTCLHDCDAIFAAAPIPNFVFGPRLLAIHFDADRATVEAAVAALAAEADAAPGVTLRWVGRTVGDLKMEKVNGEVVQAFNASLADGSLVYELDPSTDPVMEVLTLPALSAFLAETTNEAVVLLQ